MEHWADFPVLYSSLHIFWIFYDKKCYCCQKKISKPIISVWHVIEERMASIVWKTFSLMCKREGVTEVLNIAHLNKYVPGEKSCIIFLSYFCYLIWFYSRAIALTYQEHLGVTYLTLSEDPSPRIIFHNRCPVTILIKENTKGICYSIEFK